MTTSSSARALVVVAGLAVIAGVGGLVVVFGVIALLGVAALGFLLWWLRVCYRSPDRALLVILAIIVVSSHILAFAFARGVPASVLRPELAFKDVLAWLLLLVLALRAIITRDRITPGLLVVAGVALLGGFLVLGTSPAPGDVQIQSLRGALVPIVSLGCAAFLTDRERTRTAIGSIYVVTAASVYALFEMTLPRSFLTGVIGVGNFWIDVKDVPLFVDPLTNLPYNFSITSGFPRLTGTFGDPLTAGTVIGVVLVLALAYRRDLRAPTACAIVLACALLLTFTRGGWILAVGGGVVLALVRLRVTQVVGAGLTAIVLGLVAAITVPPLRSYLTGVFGGSDASTLAHQDAIAETARLSFTLWGNGWGTGGSAAQNSFDNAVTVESTYIALLTQIGIVGTVLLGVVVIGLATSALAGRTLAGVGAAVLVALAAGGLVSENMLTFNGAFPVFVGAVLLARATLAPPGPVASPPIEESRPAPLVEAVASA